MLTVSLLATVWLFAAGDPDGVVATAPDTTARLYLTDMPEVASPAAAVQAAPHGLTTDQQISRWIDERAPGTLPFADDSVSRPVDDRRIHSQFSVGVGTGGYRDYGAAVSVPLGETGRLNLSYRQVENDFPVYGYGNGYSYGGYDDFGHAPRQAPGMGSATGDKNGVATMFGGPVPGLHDRGLRHRARPRD